MTEYERYEHGVGPIYTIPLIGSLPLNPHKPGGMRQAMPSRKDLDRIVGEHDRIVAGYEVLLHHWRVQQAEIERLHSGLRGIRREFGHKSINNGNCTLGQFIDMLVSNDVAAAKRMEWDMFSRERLEATKKRLGDTDE